MLILISSAAASAEISEYLIGAEADKSLRGRSALQLLDNYLESRPEIEQRLLDRHHRIEGETWSYNSQVYASKAVMRHLIARQIKAMAELQALGSVDEIFEPRYGIGSKSHKDKGAIGNPLSFWGHPFQTEIIGQRSKRKALRVYHAFRTTLKNQLIRFARSQSLDWHRQTSSEKLDNTLRFLEEKHPAATRELREQLEKYGMDLEGLLHRAISSDLLSKLREVPAHSKPAEASAIATC